MVQNTITNRGPVWVNIIGWGRVSFGTLRARLACHVDPLFLLARWGGEGGAWATRKHWWASGAQRGMWKTRRHGQCPSSMTIFVHLLIRSVIRKSYHSDIKMGGDGCHLEHFALDWHAMHTHFPIGKVRRWRRGMSNNNIDERGGHKGACGRRECGRNVHHPWQYCSPTDKKCHPKKLP